MKKQQCHILQKKIDKFAILVTYTLSDISLPMPNQFVHIETLGCDQPQTRRGYERRLALLLSASELFLKHGYDAVSLNDIVQHAGGSKASIYKYFGNKEGLFTAICDYRRELFFNDICVPFDPKVNDLKSYLIQTLIHFYHHMIEPENIAFMRLVFERIQKDSQLAQYIHEKGPKHIQIAIANALERSAKNNKLKCDDPLASAQFYFGILRNLEWQILMGIPIQENDQETINHITYCVERFLDGHQKV